MKLIVNALGMEYWVQGKDSVCGVSGTDYPGVERSSRHISLGGDSDARGNEEVLSEAEELCTENCQSPWISGEHFLSTLLTIS